MTSSPKRPWFRFHLLTAVFMALAAGGVVWLNATLRWSPLQVDVFKYYGFPLAICTKYYTALHSEYESDWIFSPLAILIDAALALSIIGLVALISESLLRRRKGRERQYM